MQINSSKTILKTTECGTAIQINFKTITKISEDLKYSKEAKTMDIINRCNHHTRTTTWETVGFNKTNIITRCSTICITITTTTIFTLVITNLEIMVNK
jgi:hypothetical protein